MTENSIPYEDDEAYLSLDAGSANRFDEPKKKPEDIQDDTEKGSIPKSETKLTFLIKKKELEHLTPEERLKYFFRCISYDAGFQIDETYMRDFWGLQLTMIPDETEDPDCDDDNFFCIFVVADKPEKKKRKKKKKKGF